MGSRTPFSLGATLTVRRGPADSGATPTSIALATHRSNFFLMGSGLVVDRIDWVRAPGELPADRAPAAFFRVPYAGIWCLWSAFGVWQVLQRVCRYDELRVTEISW